MWFNEFHNPNDRLLTPHGRGFWMPPLLTKTADMEVGPSSQADSSRELQTVNNLLHMVF